MRGMWSKTETKENIWHNDYWNKRQAEVKKTRQVNSNMYMQKKNKNKWEDKLDKNKHAVTLSIYTETTVKTVKLSVQKSTCY